MAKSVLELAVGTGQWDAGLKKAKSALDNFTQANGGLQQALDKESQKMQQFVRMMGGMESTAKTAKGQMNDYKSTIEQLTMQYNRMSEAQKKVVGQDYLQAIEQMKQKYQSVNKEIQDMNRSLKNVEMPEMKGGGLFSGMGSKMEGALAVFGGNLMTKAAGAVASLGSEMADMVKQGVELAKQGEGIRIAFERLGRGDILDGLREATHGTVTDLELMKAAVKFNDFKLPLDELGTMLAFAQQKAKDTGQSVDYMVDSIVTGLGRKSLMILDNLGLSATEVKEKMKETGDMTKAVGAIIRDQMKNAGDYVETAADRAAQANVSLQNKMEELGRKFGPVEEASNQLWTSMKIGILDVVGGPLARLLNGLTEAGRLKNMLNNLNGESGSGNTKVDQQLKKLNVIKKAGGSDNYFNTTLSGMVEDYNRQIMALDTQIKNGGKRPGAGTGESQDVRYLQQKMDALKIMRDQLAAGAKEINKPIKIESNIPDVTDGGSGGKGGKGGKTGTDINYATDSIMAQQAEVSRLTKLWQSAGAAVRDDYKVQLDEAQYLLDRMTGKEKFDPTKMGPIADLTGRVPMPDFGVDMKRGKDGKWYDATAPVAPDELKFSDPLQKFMDYMEKQQVDDYKKRKSRDGLDDTKKVVSGLGQVASGLQQMGIELPKGVQQVLGMINGLMTVIEGVNTIIGVTQTTTLSANTAAMVALTSALYANTAVSAIPFYAHGGLIHAATGYMVPGNDHADRTLIAASSGELILNRAQQGVIASQLENGNGGGMRVVGEIQGEKIVLVANRFLKRSGQGELVTWK